jgi:hypothetical protein
VLSCKKNEDERHEEQEEIEDVAVNSVQIVIAFCCYGWKGNVA